MKSRMKRLLTIAAATGLLVTNAICSFASVQKTIYIYPNKVWDDGYYNSDDRSTRYSTVYARNISVYPENGGFDTFSKIHVRVENQYGTIISDETPLSESSTNKEISIHEGYLDTDFVCFSFRGNSNDSANAEVFYDGR